ncbi:serine protease inhibitor 3/4-like [Manduca sexta]|uniref:serine protease inhibitor 3/4-like n=1 Tax=Manduca sexta TaxID=7130 RepID=UPI0018901A5A|nr:serine protease inhibitor 3/4-like [Manduca sexta]
MDAEPSFSFSSAVAKFSTKFCNELDKTKNVVSSPLSAEILLSLLALGSTDPAHSELIKALGFVDNDSDESIRSSFSELFTKWKAIKGVTFEVANKIYIKDGGYDVEDALKKDAVEIFNVEFEKMNFKNGTVAADLINTWVEQKTHDKIKNLFSSDSLDAFTRMVLVNALYFKGEWKSKFDVDDTMKQTFHIDNETSIKIPMMFKANNFQYGESSGLEAKILRLSYAGEEMSMVFILPNEIEGLDAVMQKMAAGHDLLSELNNMFITHVNVTLPKFKIETRIDLKSLLPKLGIKAIFQENNSGLNKILNNDEPLYVSEAVQKAYIEVNEEGTEAAASTGVTLDPKSAEIVITTSYFRADHPFLYLLMGPDNTILLIGAYRGN